MTIFQNPHLELNQEYHCVEVEQVTTQGLVWLVETFGPAGSRWFHHNNKIYFKNEKDWMWFELRW